MDTRTDGISTDPGVVQITKAIVLVVNMLNHVRSMYVKKCYLRSWFYIKFIAIKREKEKCVACIQQMIQTIKPDHVFSSHDIMSWPFGEKTAIKSCTSNPLSLKCMLF